MSKEKTLEELQAELAALAADKAAAEARAKAAEAKAGDLEKKLSDVETAAAEVKAKTAPVEFKVKDGKQKGTYVFTCPTFTWDDGRVYNVRQLAEDSKKDEKVAELYATICAHLVQRESGVIRRKEK